MIVRTEAARRSSSCYRRRPSHASFLPAAAEHSSRAPLRGCGVGVANTSSSRAVRGREHIFVHHLQHLIRAGARRRRRLLSSCGDIFAAAATWRAVMPGCRAARSSARVSSDQTIRLRLRFSDRLAITTSSSVISRTIAGIRVTSRRLCRSIASTRRRRLRRRPPRSQLPCGTP